MAPNIVDSTGSLPPTVLTPDAKSKAKIIKLDKIIEPKKKKNEWLIFRKDLIWTNIIAAFILHALGMYNVFTFPYFQKWNTYLWQFCVGMCAAFGITAGAHRYWTHKAFKANVPLRCILLFCYLCAGQNTIYEWVRDHRVHHKYSETDADPHNSNRGFFFSHVGWLFVKKHPEVIAKGKQLDMSDIENDPVAAFGNKYFHSLKFVVCFLIPTIVPVIFWNEEWRYAILIVLHRYMISLNATWSVNSFAHFFGNKPYDKDIAPAENQWVSFATLGEGWHNYHHAFPSDYRAAEIGGGRFNVTTQIIDLFAKIGWATDLKAPSDALINATISKRGDGTHLNTKLAAKTL